MGVQTGARVARQVLDRYGDPAELGRDTGGQLDRVGGLGYAVVGAVVQHVRHPGGLRPGGHHQERQRPACGDGTDLVDHVEAVRVPGPVDALFVEGDDGVRLCLSHPPFDLAGRGLAHLVAGGAQGPGEPLAARSWSADHEDVPAARGIGGAVVGGGGGGGVAGHIVEQGHG